MTFIHLQAFPVYPLLQGTACGKCREGTDDACFFALDEMTFERERPYGVSSVGKLK